jgi:predicted NAD/FAD-dependent oxidoreductase
MDLAVVGAGVSGLGAAVALADTDIDVTVYEKGSVGGRAATRERNGCAYDSGANYLTSEDETVNDLVHSLGEAGLVDAEKPVWTFDAEGEIAPGEDADAHKWTYENGLAELGNRLAERSGATVHTGTEVESVASAGNGWELTTEGATETFDAALLTPPAPVTADLLAEDTEATAALAAEAREIDYRSVLSAVLHYDFPDEKPYYALVNTDDEHDIGWLARESEKQGHVPEGESLFVAQMAPDWSAERIGNGTEGAADEAADLVAELLDDERFAEPDWTDTMGWEHALAEDTADAMTVARAAQEGLFVAGDWTVAGKSRLHTSLRGGLDVGAAIADY